MQVIKAQRVKKELQDNKSLIECAEMFGVVGDKTRLKICFLLCHYPELSVTEMADYLDLSVSAVSHSLEKFKKLKLVKTRRDHKRVFYSIRETPLIKFLTQTLQIHG